MAQYTDNLHLTKPDLEERYDVNVFNDNADIIDTNLSKALSHINDTNNPHDITIAKLGYGNIDNTSDMDKPVSTATQKALDEKADKDHTHDNYAEEVSTVGTGNVITNVEINGNKLIQTKGYIPPASSTDVGGIAVGENLEVDEIGILSVPNSSLTKRGAVALTNELSDNEELATTPKAVKSALATANQYTDDEITKLIGNVPETKDTLEELVALIDENKDAVELLNNAIGTKANVSDLTAHTSDTDIHITSGEREKWNEKQDALTIDETIEPTSTGIPKTQAIKNYVDTSVKNATINISDYIDDTAISEESLWSSSKINDELDKIDYLTSSGTSSETVDNPVLTDADTLDGFDSSAFAKATHNHNDIYYTMEQVDAKISSAGGGGDIPEELLERVEAIETELPNKVDNTDTRLSDFRVPVAHSSTDSTYGIGTGTNYGHVKLSDEVDTLVGNAENGIAASQNAVYQLKQNLTTSVESLTAEVGLKADKTDLDSYQKADTAINTGNIGEQQVYFASNAGATDMIKIRSTDWSYFYDGWIRAFYIPDENTINMEADITIDGESGKYPGIRVRRAWQDGNGNDITNTYMTKANPSFIGSMTTDINGVTYYADGNIKFVNDVYGWGYLLNVLGVSGMLNSVGSSSNSRSVNSFHKFFTGEPTTWACLNPAPNTVFVGKSKLNARTGSDLNTNLFPFEKLSMIEIWYYVTSYNGEVVYSPLLKDRIYISNELRNNFISTGDDSNGATVSDYLTVTIYGNDGVNCSGFGIENTSDSEIVIARIDVYNTY